MSSPGGFSSTKLFVATAAALHRVIAAFSLIKYPSIDRTLVNLKEKLVKHYWATARAFVDKYRIRPYALFWHEDAGKSLCAPGGKWAVRDRGEPPVAASSLRRAHRAAHRTNSSE